MVVEHAHGLRQRRGPNAKSSLHKAHLAPDAGLQAPGASLSFYRTFSYGWPSNPDLNSIG